MLYYGYNAALLQLVTKISFNTYFNSVYSDQAKHVSRGKVSKMLLTNIRVYCNKIINIQGLIVSDNVKL